MVFRLISLDPEKSRGAASDGPNKNEQRLVGGRHQPHRRISSDGRINGLSQRTGDMYHGPKSAQEGIPSLWIPCLGQPDFERRTSKTLIAGRPFTILRTCCSSPIGSSFPCGKIRSPHSRGRHSQRPLSTQLAASGQEDGATTDIMLSARGLDMSALWLDCRTLLQQNIMTGMPQTCVANYRAQAGKTSSLSFDESRVLMFTPMQSSQARVSK